MCHIAAALAHTRCKTNAKLQRQDELPMHCTLLISDLLPPSDLGAGPFADLRVPHISMLLARGETARRPPLASEDWLCEQFGVPTQPDRPLAALMLQADGGEPLHYYWLCAEPVQLRVDRNRLIVAARVADYTAAEASELVAALNRHFNADGLEFIAPTPSRWYARTARTPALTTTPLTQALNRSSKHHLPQGADALAWHGVMNEAQMILHTHPVNTEREARGIASRQQHLVMGRWHAARDHPVRLIRPLGAAGPCCARWRSRRASRTAICLPAATNCCRSGRTIPGGARCARGCAARGRFGRMARARERHR